MDIEKYELESLEFIFCEVDKLANHIHLGIRETRNKSFTLFAVLVSLSSFVLTQIDLGYSWFVLLPGALVSLFFLYKNLFPKEIAFIGALPSQLTCDGKGGSKKKYLATQIENYEKAIKINEKVIEDMVSRFKNSARVLLITLFLFSVLSFHHLMSHVCRLY